MFDSSYNANSILPIHQGSNHHPFDDHLFINNFPTHLLDDDELFLDTILPYNNPPPLSPPRPQPLPITIDEATNIDQLIGEKSGESEKKVPQKGIMKKQDGRGGGPSKRRAGKKDRHSKIYTAHGLRDRRMRLSLQIARKFFDLQDILGFDKASKTIEWLFNKSKAAIKDLSDKSCTSIIIPSSPLGEGDDPKGDGGGNDILKLSEIGSNNKGVLKTNEKRKEARARARERTKEKLKVQKQGNEKISVMKNKETLELEENPNSLTLTSRRVKDNKVDSQQQPLEDQMASVGIIEKFLATSSSFDDFTDDGALTRAFSMDLGQFGAISTKMADTIIVNSEYPHIQQGPNFVFLDRIYNQGY